MSSREGKELVMAWQLNGQLIESCSCNMFCPCWFGVQDLMIMDRGWCAGALALRVDEGDVDGVDLSGRTIVIAIHFPGPTLYDGNATARVFIDDGATDDQRRELEPILHGEKGGPMEVFGGLVESWLPTESASIDLREDGDAIAVGVGEMGDLKSQLLRDPDGQPFTLRGGGFVGGFGLEEAELAPSATQWNDPEMPLPSFETKSGARGAFAWSG
jgi:hypothetical protein